MKNVLITGATSGIGKVASIELANAGHHVLALSRNPAKSQTLLDDYNETQSQTKGKLEIVKGDLSILEGLQDAIDDVKERIDQPDILINNAGIWNFSFRESANHIEETLQVNVLAPAILTHAFLPEMTKNGGRLIFTSSGLHQGEINFEDMEFRSKYSGFKAYRQSKLMNIMIARYLSQKYGAMGLEAYSQHPGFVNTKLGRDAPLLARLFFKWFGKSPAKGAHNLIYLSKEEVENLENGAYYKDMKPDNATSYSQQMSVAAELVRHLENLIPNNYLKDRKLFEMS